MVWGGFGLVIIIPLRVFVNRSSNNNSSGNNIEFENLVLRTSKGNFLNLAKKYYKYFF